VVRRRRAVRNGSDSAGRGAVVAHRPQPAQHPHHRTRRAPCGLALADPRRVLDRHGPAPRSGSSPKATPQSTPKPGRPQSRLGLVRHRQPSTPSLLPTPPSGLRSPLPTRTPGRSACAQPQHHGRSTERASDQKLHLPTATEGLRRRSLYRCSSSNSSIMGTSQGLRQSWPPTARW
jgi:hypothetical protein